MTNNSEMPSHHGPHGSAGGHDNDTMRLLLERASVRDFESREIPDDVFNDIMRAAAHAPTGGNLQPYSIIAVNPDRHGHVEYIEAMRLIAWITSPEGQAMIGAFRKEGEILFHPTAVPIEEK